MKRLDVPSRPTASKSITRQLHDVRVLTASSGYRLLVRDAIGTGGSDVASAIGALTGRSVYVVETSDLFSKYIGETEKNLDALLERAAREDWILLFDEADALFGRRTDVTSANDRYANLEISHLLQKIEQYRGIAILATNLKTSIDEAVLRRFDKTVVAKKPTR